MKANSLHKAFKLDNVSYTKQSLLQKAQSFIDKSNDFEAEIGRFLIDWLDDNDTLKVQTSGSTGDPKSIHLSKEAMKASALATGTYFNLIPGQTALLCLPVSYIAGKMMLVRAMVLGLEIDTILPKIDLDLSSKGYDFVAMIPSQVDKNKDILNQFSIVIVGGGSIPHSLKHELQQIKASVYETYGMTETITHIAIKPLNKVDYKPYFKILPDITISQDERNCLVIDAPNISKETIITNDVVNLYSDTEFEWLGRVDHVINSGGLKLFPENIEAKLEPYLDVPFFIASQPNSTFGEEVILIIEGETFPIDSHVYKDLNKAEIPKHVYFVPGFVETASGKIQRQQTLNLLS
ncbi:AMP-binding protein [Aurantibacter aestuarii]|uniref:O-succinylbenzoic acid--CoA ligase n=1 Tax=Aurantibacter aestuarii TaxID=1266046 RepID=A0A2T1N953_9FLAO|nr:AMP-binding protein [Aurantibacter aestuarii]PSG88388.1 O-succinylbenzoic acid--CoA ligase [Aurantibacter aestuarii]